MVSQLMSQTLMSGKSNELKNAHNSMVVVVGDLSADNYVSQLVQNIKSQNSNIHIFGLGGPKMAKCDMELIANCDDLSIMGIFETLSLVPRLMKLKKSIIDEIAVKNPKLALLVDFSGFNLDLAKSIKKRFPKLPIYYFISPQIWFSRPWRVKTIAKYIDKMFVIFPFEEDLYKENNVDAKFIGHPLLKRLKGLTFNSVEFCAKYDIDPNKKLIAVFPGSRQLEIKNFSHILFDAVINLSEIDDSFEFAMSCANEYLKTKIDQAISTYANKDKLLGKLKLVNNVDNYELLNACSVVWGKAGTTTLESTLFKKPIISFYKASYISYLTYLLFRQTKYASLPNILSKKYFVPELIQNDFTPVNLINYTFEIINNQNVKDQMSEYFESVVSKLGSGDFLDNLTCEIMQILNNTNNIV